MHTVVGGRVEKTRVLLHYLTGNRSGFQGRHSAGARALGSVLSSVLATLARQVHFRAPFANLSLSVLK